MRSPAVVRSVEAGVAVAVRVVPQAEVKRLMAERPQALLDEDRIIAKWPLAMRKADIRIVKDTEVFE